MTARMLPMARRHVYTLEEVARMLCMHVTTVRSTRERRFPHARRTGILAKPWLVPLCCVANVGEEHEDGWEEAVLWAQAA